MFTMAEIENELQARMTAALNGHDEADDDATAAQFDQAYESASEMLADFVKHTDEDFKNRLYPATGEVVHFCAECGREWSDAFRV